MNTNASASAGTRLISSPHPPPLSVTKYARPSPQSLRKRHGQLRQLNPSASSSSSSLALQPVSPSPSSRAISIKQEGGGGSDYSLNNINYGHASNNPFSSTSISAATATASAAESKNSQSLVFEEDHPHFPSNISSSSSSSLAAQIDDVMAQHVRLLQSKLSQSESVRAELSDRLKQSDQRYDKLKRHAEKRGMTAQAIRQLDEKLWESQLANEQLRNDLSMADAAAVKHSSENKKLTLQLAALQEQIDTLTQTQEQLTDSLDKVSGRAESEHGAHGRAVAALQQEKMELQRRLDDRDVQLEDLKHQQQFLLLQQQQKGNHETGDNQDNTVSSLDPRPRNNSTSKYPPQTIPPSDFQAHIQRYEESIRNFTHSLNQSRSQVTLLQSELDAARAEADELRSMLCEAQETIEALHLESTTDALGGELIEGILESGLAQQFLKR